MEGWKDFGKTVGAVIVGGLILTVVIGPVISKMMGKSNSTTPPAA